MTFIAAIDPGTTESALVLWDGEKVQGAVIEPNEKLIEFLRAPPTLDLVIEQVESYGMAVGKEVFATVWWAGRFAEAGLRSGGRVEMVPRRRVKLHLCQDSRAKEANINQALKDRFGGKGTKASPGVLYEISSHKWAALALAVTVFDERAARERAPMSEAVYRALDQA